MSTQRQLRRGTNAENEAFTGAVAETVFDTTKNRLVNHNGSVVGGFPVPNFVDLQNGAFTCADGVGTNTITLALEKAPTAYAEYQSFTFKPQNNNTGATTLNVNSLGAKDIKKDDGTGTLVALEADDLKANIPVNVVYDGTQFIAQLGGGSPNVYIAEFTSSGTFTKPAGYDYFIVELWGAGGGGGKSTASSGCGGGGGGYSFKRFEYADIGTSETVTIGAGGAKKTTQANGGTGGESTFGSLLTAYGGSGGRYNANGGAGGGSGLSGFPCRDSAGNGYTATAGTSSSYAVGGIASGGGGGYYNNITYGVGADSIYGGGGGGGASSGGNSIYGGGGGSDGALAGGTSLYGGNGGTGVFTTGNATDGAFPAGGGGASSGGAGDSGAGGGGYCIVRGYKNA